MDEMNEEEKAYPLTKQTANDVEPRDSLLVAREIENHYRDGIIAYVEGISRYSLETSKLKANISTEKKLIEKDEATLIVFERKVSYDEKLLQKYNDSFSQKIHSMQELNREANTLASKSNDTETTRAAVDLKVLIEKMREQIMNIE